MGLVDENKRPLGRTGFEKSSKIIDQNYFSDITMYGATGNMKIKSTQDKVDLNISFDGMKNPMTATLKSYRANAETIHIHSGTSLLKFLQNYVAFTNHYLNLTINNRARQKHSPPSSVINDM